jgi:hypothetical protein
MVHCHWTYELMYPRVDGQESGDQNRFCPSFRELRFPERL